MGSPKNDIEYIRSYIKNLGGELLSEKYLGNKYPLLIKFPDGEIETRTFNNLRNKKRLVSQKERYKNTSNRQKQSVEEIRKVVESKGGELLSTEYINPHMKLSIRTIDGEIEERSFNSIKQTKILLSKKKVRENVSNESKLSFSDISEIITEKGGTLLDQNIEYENVRTTLNVQCSCGEITKNCIFNIQANFKNKITCIKCRDISIFETEVYNYVKDIYDGLVIRNDREIIKPQELDIVIPDHKIAIECNGIYWHSESIKKNRKYHIDKTNKANTAGGYQLIHINDSEWVRNGELIKDLIRKRLGLVENRIYARKCKIIKVSSKEAKNFLNDNHLQGNVYSKYNYGLTYKDNLVSLMTFSKPRFNNNAEFELYRFCNKINTSVVGAFSKMLKHFINEINPKSIISYCDIAHFSGEIYKNNNFRLEVRSPPNYKYFNKRDYILHSRNKFQKHKLFSKLKKFDSKLTEYENMQANGYHRIWDCGNDVYLLNREI